MRQCWSPPEASQQPAAEDFQPLPATLRCVGDISFAAVFPGSWFLEWLLIPSCLRTRLSLSDTHIHVESLLKPRLDNRTRRMKGGAARQEVSRKLRTTPRSARGMSLPPIEASRWVSGYEWRDSRAIGHGSLHRHLGARTCLLKSATFQEAL
jgi:hypothetical protein